MYPLFRYHVPRSFVKLSGNLLVLLEEEGGDPLGISLVTVAADDSKDRSSKQSPSGETQDKFSLQDRRMRRGQEMNFS